MEFDTLGEDGFEDVAFVVSVFGHFSLCIQKVLLCLFFPLVQSCAKQINYLISQKKQKG